MPMSTIYGGITPPPDPNNPTPPSPIIVDPNKPVFVVTQEQWDRAKDAAGKFWPTLKEYWPQITIVLVGLGSLIGSGTYVATKNTEPPAPPIPVVEPKVVIDLKPVLDGLLKIDNSVSGLRGDINGLSKKIDEKPIVDPLVPPTPDNATNTLPAETIAKVGRQTTLTAKVSGEVYWVIPPGSPCDSEAFGNRLIFTPTMEAQFPLGAYSQTKGKWNIAWTMVKVGNAPIPPPPTPNDPFVSSLQAAYERDGKNPIALSKMVVFYQVSDTIVNNDANKTPSDVFSVAKKAMATMLKEPDSDKATVLVNLRQAISKELDKTLPLGSASTQPLTAESRHLINTQFQRVHNALKGVTP